MTSLIGRDSAPTSFRQRAGTGNCAGVSYSQRIDIPEVLAWIESFL
jgi:hypothetical protein